MAPLVTLRLNQLLILLEMVPCPRQNVVSKICPVGTNCCGSDYDFLGLKCPQVIVVNSYSREKHTLFAYEVTSSTGC
jgi:hypothetical protein